MDLWPLQGLNFPNLGQIPLIMLALVATVVCLNCILMGGCPQEDRCALQALTRRNAVQNTLVGSGTSFSLKLRLMSEVTRLEACFWLEAVIALDDARLLGVIGIIPPKAPIQAARPTDEGPTNQEE